mgnify:CR=1 FL=1
MRVASIDIGTNTLLLLIAEVKDGKITTLHNSQIIAGLGKNIDADGLIQKEAFDKISDALIEFKKISEKFGVEKIFAVGTSALRDAKNRDEFLNFIKRKTGIEIKVISGEEEARLTYLGAVSGLDEEILKTKITVIDIGGGSTEVILGLGFEIEKFISLDIGTVRITRKFLKHSPPLDEEIENAKFFIRNEFERIRNFEFAGSNLVGVAATVTTVASYSLNLQTYDGEKINGYVMGIETIEKIYEKFKNLSIAEISKIPQISKGREDVIFAGVLILFEFMKKFNFKSIIASDRGVRYGVIFNLLRTNSL